MDRSKNEADRNDRTDEISPATSVVHGAYEPSDWSGAISPPIVLSSTYECAGALRSEEVDRFEYSRVDNPNRQWLEQSLAHLEGGTHALAFSSGCAAITSVLQAMPAQASIWAEEHIYGGTYRILTEGFGAWEHKLRWVNFDSLASSRPQEAALEGAKEGDLLWLETPCNPSLKVWDLENVIGLAKARGMLVCVDNTFATPLLQRPFDCGADIIVHSTSKYINGHSDVVGGAVVVRDEELASRLHSIQFGVGAVPSPFDCFLTLRGMQTMALRVERHCHNALVLAEYLASQAAKAATSSAFTVLYPGLPSHPDHQTARKQMKGFGGVVSIDFKGGALAAASFLEHLRFFRIAGSLGGVESLACHPRSSSHMSVPLDRCERTGIRDGLVRLSVGIEDSEDLRRDIGQALTLLD